ncbi:cysteine desulfurase [Amycolatopsis antarctica]|uniref:Cysteine desulfurase n=1 Tax=Amycolatopsis antarctica TaxID=1854586 RepID=A0A263D7L6_9PSEU|nr:aminotransferase class V-fold PLP-dependent enzyme [Amycolatopsis antarctica]OZM74524.1 cysteine desulfurase [Amycolatopsis antarctica]
MTLALDRIDTVPAPAPVARAPRAVPAVAGAGLRVPLVTGGTREYANLDHAASAPCLAEVRRAVDEFLPWYASVHRGAGFASQVSTRVHERSRDIVARFLGARRGDTVVFTRNTTDALTLLARSVPRHTAVVQFDTEHHAALLPWRGPHVRRIATPSTRSGAIAALDAALADCPEGPRLVVVTGASNVTGEVLPVAEFAAVARRHGARIALDGAQLAPHRPISLRELDVDYVAISGHKLYAPFGAGALAGRADWLRAAPPYLAGGGASRSVAADGERVTVAWNDGPERHEGGSPNTVGVYALGVACAELERHAGAVAAHEDELLARLRRGLAGVPGLHTLRLFADDPAVADVVGTVSFVIEGHDPGRVAAALSAEYGIGVRDGAFCAHIATRRLVGRTGTGGAKALRASIGLGTTTEHVDRLVTALRRLVTGGERWSYAELDGRWAPTPDPRELPPFLR